MSDNKSGYISFDAEVPQPIEKEVKGFVQYGKDNLYPQFLNSLYYDNPIHQGIINQKVMFALGDGLEGDEATLNNSVSKHSLDEVIEQVFYDLEIQEGYYLLFKWSVTDQVWYVENLPFELVRPSEDLTRFAYSEDWLQGTQNAEKTGYKEYDSFWNPIKDDNGQILSKELVMYIKPNSKQIKIEGTKKLTSNIFPIPSYSGAIVSIMAGIEMDWFHYAESVNGWSSNTIINMNNGIPETPEIKRDLEDSIKKRATDKKKKGGITILYNDGKERAADIVNMGGNGNDTKYLATQDHVMQTIMIGHGVQNPALFGLEVAGKLGNNADNVTPYLRFMDTYVKRRRKNVLDSILYGLGKLNGTRPTVTFKEYIPEWIKPKEVTPTQAIQMSAEIQTKDVLDLFANAGRSKEGVQFVSGQKFTGQSDDECLNAFYSGQFSDLTGQQIKILNLINTGQSFQAIIDAMKLNKARLAYEIMKLTVRGYIRDWKLTSKAEANVPRTEQIKVVYSYELRPDVPKAKQSREFCEELIKRDRIYTREEIDQISNAIGRDVWSYRGGWYRNPDTERTTPSCRHYWKQNVIIDRATGTPTPTNQVPPNLTIDTVKKQTVQNIQKDLGLSDVKVSYGKIAGGLGGATYHVKKGDVWKMDNRIKINDAKYASNPEKLAQVIRHEMRHIYQSEKMGFYIKGDHFYWQNKPYISIKEYDKLMNTFSKAKTKELYEEALKKYNDLPWEKDANEYMKKMIFNKDIPYIERVEDNGLIDLIEIPEELLKTL